MSDSYKNTKIIFETDAKQKVFLKTATTDWSGQLEQPKLLLVIEDFDQERALMSREEVALLANHLITWLEETNENV